MPLRKSIPRYKKSYYAIFAISVATVVIMTIF